MKYLDEFRDPADARRLAAQMAEVVTRPWTVMEVCGGQTHAIVRFGIDRLVPDGVTLLHGPGCPVCVTPIGIMDQAILIARRPEVTFCTFGDMLRVPGTESTLSQARAAGADLRIVYSPLDAVKLAQAEPTRQVVFFGVGFETTAPAVAMAVHHAAQLGLPNFSVLLSHVLVPPALEAIAGASERTVDGFLAAGHVCTVMGTAEYAPLAARHRVPIVVTGFEPSDLMRGLLMCLKQLEEGRHEVENAYARAVRPEGNERARQMIAEVFEVVPRAWRGIGEIPSSGLGLRGPYQQLDAALRFGVDHVQGREDHDCLSGEILQGLRKPDACPAFGTRCTPDHPLGSTMVSSEGACAAWFRYRGTR